MIEISENMSKYMFLKNLKGESDNSLHSKLKFIKSRKIAKKCEENKIERKHLNKVKNYEKNIFG